MTFSLAGRCARTGMFGAVVTSSSPAVAARCSWARASVGAACTQNVTDPSLGNRLLDALAEGRTAQQALDEVMASATYPEFRQLTVVDSHGNTAAFSGSQTLGLHAAAKTANAVAAGNLLANEKVAQAMVDAFEADPEAEIGERLLAGVLAGQAAGGEQGPTHSCGLVVVDKVSWPVTDLRVDWDVDPIGKLRQIWKVWQPQADEYVARALNPASAPSYGVPGDE